LTLAFLWLRESQVKEQKDGVSSRMVCSECSPEDKIARGCTGGVKWGIGPYTIDRCPENYVTDEMLAYIRMWSDYKLFGWPFPGHWSEQPAYVVDAIRTLENVPPVAGQ